jgi:hypothetical protein
MVKSSSPNLPNTWLIFLCPCTQLPRRTCPHSTSSIFAVHISCSNFTVLLFRKPEFINKTLLHLCLLQGYYVIHVYSFRYYPWFHVTAIGLGTYYPWIRWHTCILWAKKGSSSCVEYVCSIIYVAIRTICGSLR